MAGASAIDGDGGDKRGCALVVAERLRAEETARHLGDAGLGVMTCAPTDLSTAPLADADLVVVDVTAVPSIDSDSLCRWLRDRTDVPVLAIDGSGLDPLHHLRDGADMVLRADCGPGELTARARALLRRTPPRRRPVAPEVIEFAGLRVDRTTTLLRVGDAELPLLEPELAAIWLLLANGHRVTRRPPLAAAFGVDETELDGQVRKLRQRLEAVEGWRRIVALRGVGFRVLTGPSSEPFAKSAAVVPGSDAGERVGATTKG